MNEPKTIGYCALVTLVALYIVGAASNEVLRHVVQTLPLWFPIVMGLRGREIAKWASPSMLRHLASAYDPHLAVSSRLGEGHIRALRTD
jgi:hypothetical protein